MSRTIIQMFMAALLDGGLELEPLTHEDLRRVHELILKYADLSAFNLLP